jgi:hypothetical protein
MEIIFISTFKVMLKARTSFLYILLAFGLQLIFLVICFSLNAVHHELVIPIGVHLIEALEIFPCRASMITNIGICCLISVLIWNTKVALLYFPIGLEIEGRIKMEDWEFLNMDANKKFVATFKYTENFNVVVKNCFGTHGNIDMIIENMLNPNELSSLDIKLNKYMLDIDNKMLQKKYDIYSNKRFLVYTRIVMWASCLTFLLYSMLQGILAVKIKSAFYLNFYFFFCYLIFCLLSYHQVLVLNIDKYALVTSIIIVICTYYSTFIRSAEFSVLSSVMTLYLCVQFNLSFRVVMKFVVIEMIGFTIAELVNWNGYKDS